MENRRSEKHSGEPYGPLAAPANREGKTSSSTSVGRLCEAFLQFCARLATPVVWCSLPVPTTPRARWGRDVCDVCVDSPLPLFRERRPVILSTENARQQGRWLRARMIQPSIPRKTVSRDQSALLSLPQVCPEVPHPQLPSQGEDVGSEGGSGSESAADTKQDRACGHDG